MRKGIILAGGRGTRLGPVTQAVNKHLLPVYDKPMIYYPLTTLMLAGIKDILIITNPLDIDPFNRILLDGKQWGLNISYLPQWKPNGIPEAFIIAEEFIGKDDVVLILGDNLFYANNLRTLLDEAAYKANEWATIFSYHVKNPQDYGVLKPYCDGGIEELIEKPSSPDPDYRAVPGFYYYPNTVIDIAKSLKPSARGELEIMDINREYLKMSHLEAMELGRGIAWFDCGTFDNLLAASQFVQIVQERQGVKIGDPNELARLMA